MGRDRGRRGPSGRCRRSAGPRPGRTSGSRTSRRRGPGRRPPWPRRSRSPSRPRRPRGGAPGASLTPSPVTATVRPALAGEPDEPLLLVGGGPGDDLEPASSAARRASSQPARSSPTDDRGRGRGRPGAAIAAGRQRMVAGDDDDLDPGDRGPSRAPRGSRRASGRRSRSSARTDHVPPSGGGRRRPAARRPRHAPRRRAAQAACSLGRRRGQAEDRLRGADRGLLDVPTASAARLRVRDHGRPSATGSASRRAAGSSVGSPPASLDRPDERRRERPGRRPLDPRPRRRPRRAGPSARQASRAGSVDRPGQVRDGHDVEPVARQRAGLVGDDEVDRAERLLRVEPADEDAAPEQPVGAQTQDDREQDRRLLGDGRDRRRDAGQQVRPGVLAAGEAEAGDDRDQPDGDDQQDPDQPVELGLERRAAALARARGRRRSGRPPTPGRWRRRRPRRGRRRRSSRRRPSPSARRAACRSASGLGRRRLRHGFAGQDAAVDQQPIRPHEAQVGRHDVARPEQDDVAGHEARRGDVRDRAVRAGPGPSGRSPSRSASSARSPRYSVTTSAPTIGNRRDQDEQAVADLAERDGQDAGDDEQEDEGLGGGLEDELRQRGPRARARARSGPASSGSAGGLLGRQADARGRRPAPRRPRRPGARARRPRAARRRGSGPPPGRRSVERSSSRSSPNGVRSSRCKRPPSPSMPTGRRPPRDRLGRRPRDRLRHDDPALALSRARTAGARPGCRAGSTAGRR